MKIGICDDNIVLSSKYQGMLECCARQTGIEVDLQLFPSGSELVKAIQKDKECLDILFLDILMDKMNGIETAKKLQEFKCKAVIVFLTSSEEYVFETAGIKSLAYLMKDELSQAGMVKVFEEAVKKVKERKSDILEFQKDDGSYRISYEDICFIKTYQGYSYIHHWDGIIIEYRDQDICKQLEGKGFFQVHPQYIVGLRYIMKIEKKQIILNDASRNVIPLDRLYANGLKFAFADFVMKGM